MEDLQTDTLSDYGKKPNSDLDSSKENACAASPLNGCDDLDPLDLMDHCENESIASNSDVWKGSDSEDEIEPKDNQESEKSAESKETIDASDTLPETNEQVEEELKSEAVGNEETTKAESESKPEETKVDEIDDIKKTDNREPSPAKDNVPEILEKASEEVVESKSEQNVTEQNGEEEKEDNLTKRTEVEENKEKNSEAVEVPYAENVSSEVKESVLEGALKGTITAEGPEKAPPASGEPPKDFVAANFGEAVHGPINEDEHDDCQMDYDAEDDDFDPSLLCPEVSMDVDDNPVVTTNGPVPDGECTSPLPLEPLFSTFVDEITGAEISFNLTPEELEMKKKLYGPRNPIQATKVHCTACNVHLGSALEGQNNRFVHPLLKVLICKECYHFYTSGEFEKDEDGSELYCRWCGQGGQVLCCSKCEFVFCKRCIRTNFGKKKMIEIRDSDNWDCFRCNSSQLITQRIHCFEFFEYVRKEMSRAATFNGSEVWSTDYSRCCMPKKRQSENVNEAVKKPKKRKSDIDPDYDPVKENAELAHGSNPLAMSNQNVHNAGFKGMVIPKQMHIVQRYVKPQDNDIEFVRQIPAPSVTINNLPKATFRTILPTTARPGQNPPVIRINPPPLSPPALVPTSNRSHLANRLTGLHTPALMKHEWFEKTVRAAARVNSHLSYTLTQLNKAQSQAASVEELAVVHNKLQEILSSSINSLIQIRKNLRTEFIAGIKTVRLPSKKMDAGNDDDVILVSAPASMPMPSTSFIRPPNDPLIIIEKSNQQKVPPPPQVDGLPPPKTFLKVKSMMELQNVPSECITIPDDPPVMSKELPDVICNGDIDPLAITPVLEVTVDKKQSDRKETCSIDNEVPKRSKSKPCPKSVRKSREAGTSSSVNTVKAVESPEIERMKSVKVRLPRENLELLQKKWAGMVNK